MRRLVVLVLAEIVLTVLVMAVAIAGAAMVMAWAADAVGGHRLDILGLPRGIWLARDPGS